MGKHSGDPDNREPSVAGTDAGVPFGTLDGAARGTEFDASHDSPTGYAERNFTPGSINAGTYEAERARQREQQDRNR